MRIGQGYDLHRTVPEKPLLLGGVNIPSDFGLEGHSDADVLAHAVTDALLGALALGDIGRHFPDTEERYRGADSMKLLSTVVDMLEEKNYMVGNLDTTVIAQKPRLANHIDNIRSSLARTLKTPIGMISVKAKTNEQVDAVGRGEAIAVHAVVLLLPQAD